MDRFIAQRRFAMTRNIAFDPETNAELISKITHDVRNTVRALMIVPDWIKDDLKSHGIELPDDVVGHFDLMALHARRLDKMVQDCTTYFRVGEKSGNYVRDLSRQLAALIANLDVPTGFKVTQDVQIENIGIPEGDLIILLSALMSNGIKHHDRKAGHLHVSAMPEDGGCRIIVSDDGPGIAKNDIERVFKVMTTLRPRDEVEGSGMGLAIALKIVTHYGGALQLSTGPDETGSIFEVWFPGVEALQNDPTTKYQ